MENNGNIVINQHYVPVSFLNKFSNKVSSNYYLLEHAKNNDNLEIKKTKQVCCEKEFYELKGMDLNDVELKICKPENLINNMLYFKLLKDCEEIKNNKNIKDCIYIKDFKKLKIKSQKRISIYRYILVQYYRTKYYKDKCKSQSEFVENLLKMINMRSEDIVNMGFYEKYNMFLCYNNSFEKFVINDKCNICFFETKELGKSLLFVFDPKFFILMIGKNKNINKLNLSFEQINEMLKNDAYMHYYSYPDTEFVNEYRRYREKEHEDEFKGGIS